MEALKSPLVMRRSIYIEAPPGRVWKEFESIERLRRWYAGKVATIEQRILRYEPGVGGWLELECEWTHGTPGRCHLGGEIVAFEPARELTIAQHSFYPKRPTDQPIMKTFRLSPALDGTVVEILEHGFEATGDHAAAYHRESEAGWTMFELEALRLLVERAEAAARAH
jgi:uncharacterized protein YndB with AHSA1/START domain